MCQFDFDLDNCPWIWCIRNHYDTNLVRNTWFICGRPYCLHILWFKWQFKMFQLSNEFLNMAQCHSDWLGDSRRQCKHGQLFVDREFSSHNSSRACIIGTYNYQVHAGVVWPNWKFTCWFFIYPFQHYNISSKLTCSTILFWSYIKGW